ncbi:Crp/Fnr family transcriptional regulator [Polaribacter porphyrae]|uniref:Cyclic nucleotide-binding domain-containing protein n=1 Tax=Polaribacter porphyrae TaxID=1137780 RepID=A0A2S7WMN0_9FLAO|nr:Crp/Fnr family transcriptional regulator [Polaribacter porphyrae]PQJ78877.1 hypothetical protein BTO18_06625 [Polaribacter porphyrae]
MNIKEYTANFIDYNFDGNLPFKTILKKVKKGTIITDYDELEKKVYFLIDGIVKVSIMKNEEERILDFIFNHSFFASYSSLLTNNPSDVSIKTYTDCTLEVVDYLELKKAYTFSMIANKLGRIETEKLYTKKVRREKELLTKTAEERYLLLATNYPEVLKRIAIKDISKYLGIQPESLSRIRKRLIS